MMIIQGEQLIEQVNCEQVNEGDIVLWWLGQHSFIFKTGNVIIYIDLFLSDHGKRLIPPLLSASQITNAHFFIGTHNHRDHIDKEIWPTLAASSPNASFIVPEKLKSELSSELNIPIERFWGMNDGDSVYVSSDGHIIDVSGAISSSVLQISAIASAHEFLDKDEKTQLYPYLGYVFSTNRVSVYHAGDCCIYEGLQTKLDEFGINCMLLPINGRDAVKYNSGIVGNMTYQEAADLAGAINPELVIPTHFDMFPGNKTDPALFRDYVQAKYKTPTYHIKVKIPKYTQKVSIRV